MMELYNKMGSIRVNYQKLQFQHDHHAWLPSHNAIKGIEELRKIPKTESEIKVESIHIVARRI